MCFSPQWRAIFRHLNFQKWSKHAVFCTFWLANVLFATAACNFWFLLWAPTSAPAALTGLLFDWPDTRIIEKTQHFATSLTFGADVSSFFWLSRYCIFCRLTWWLYCWAMHLLFNCPYCRKFLFKLPSTIHGSYIYLYLVHSCYISYCAYKITQPLVCSARVFETWKNLKYWMPFLQHYKSKMTQLWSWNSPLRFPSSTLIHFHFFRDLHSWRGENENQLPCGCRGCHRCYGCCWSCWCCWRRMWRCRA